MKYLKYIYLLLRSAGIDPIRFINFLRGIPFYIRDYFFLKRQLTNNDFKFGKMYPILYERFEESGSIKGPYFYQDLYVASRVFLNNPQKHVDIGSRIDGFIAHVATFRAIEVFDIRPQQNKVKNVTFIEANLMDLPKNLLASCDSISSLHAIEHFGLGRYSDPIDANGHIKAIDNVRAILQPNGIFYFSVPIGPQRIEFNAHRVFSLEYLLKIFENKFSVEHFSYIDDKTNFFENVILTPDLISKNAGCEWGCGIFELKKL